jgi:phage-related minor tail protein
MERNVPDNPTHAEVLRAIGHLEGKLDSIHDAIQHNRTSMMEAFRRLNEVEKRVAQGVILAIVLSIIVPLLVTIAEPRISVPQHQEERQ